MSADRDADDLSMDSIEATSHPFILRIWLEEPAAGIHRAKWRGHITHVPSGERAYIEDLDQILEFIIPYLRDMGVSVGGFHRLRCWLSLLTERWRFSL
jgi:hypothetical protein